MPIRYHHPTQSAVCSCGFAGEVSRFVACDPLRLQIYLQGMERRHKCRQAVPKHDVRVHRVQSTKLLQERVWKAGMKRLMPETTFEQRLREVENAEKLGLLRALCVLPADRGARAA